MGLSLQSKIVLFFSFPDHILSAREVVAHFFDIQYKKMKIERINRADDQWAFSLDPDDCF